MCPEQGACASCESGKNAEVAKLVYALALGASGATHGGSSPLLGTSSDLGLWSDLWRHKVCRIIDAARFTFLAFILTILACQSFKNSRRLQ